MRVCFGNTSIGNIALKIKSEEVFHYITWKGACNMQPNTHPTILVTGSTDGIGRIAADKLMRMDANVLLHGRNREKCRAARDDLQKTVPAADPACYEADFSSLSQVREMAAAIRESHDRLDVLINNAGVFPAVSNQRERPVSREGHELCMAVNFLAPFLLTHLLLPLLAAAPAGRIINVTSAAQEAIDFEDLMCTIDYSPMLAYARSKLALAMFTFELDLRLKAENIPENITVNCMHPGSLLDTEMVRQSFSRPQGSSESGAEVEVYLATSPGLEGISGAYFNRMKPASAHSQAYDPKARQRLWEAAMALTGLSPTGSDS